MRAEALCGRPVRHSQLQHPRPAARVTRETARDMISSSDANMLNPSRIPNILYKYMGMERASIFACRRFAFTAHCLLNDIFEMRPKVSLNTSSLLARHDDETMIVHSTLDEAAVLCLSESWDIIPMWSYYAESHEGFGVGLSLASSFFSGREPIPVSYCQEYPVVTLEAGFRDAVYTKFDQWQHEHEWRCLAVPSEDGQKYEHPVGKNGVYLAELEPDLIAEVILGHRIDNETERYILGPLKSSEYAHVQIYRAKPDPNAWRLTRQRVPEPQ